MNMITYGTGQKDDPWILRTPPMSSEFLAWEDKSLDPPALIIQVSKTKLSYQLRAITDCYNMLLSHNDWMVLGNADEDKPVKTESLEAWARSPTNPVNGYYGLRKGYRGRFANYISPVMELLGMVELEHNARNNRVRAIHK